MPCYLAMVTSIAIASSTLGKVFVGCSVNSSNTSLDTNVGKTKLQNSTKKKTTTKTFFVLVFFAISNFFLALEILFSAFPVFVILHFSSAWVPRDEKYKIAKTGNAEKKFSAAEKNPKSQKPPKQKLFTA